jgi:cob(I)alamin adenosyltransferase
MSRLYTRGGDDGSTALGDGTRVGKEDQRIEAFGSLDEAQAAAGVARAYCDDELLRDLLRFAQQRLSNCAALLATSGRPGEEAAGVSEADTAVLEAAIDKLEERTGPAEGFILPGGSIPAAQLHVARATVRRAERRVAALESPTRGDRDVGRFLNRLSDMLFAAARWANVDQNRSETDWDPDAAPPDLR